MKDTNIGVATENEIPYHEAFIIESLITAECIINLPEVHKGDLGKGSLETKLSMCRGNRGCRS
jgi:hypothetical protein